MSEAAITIARHDRALPDVLNRECFCVTLDRPAFDAALTLEAGADFAASLLKERPHLVSTTPVFLAKADRTAMLSMVKAIEAATRLPQYRAQALERSVIAERDLGPLGAFMGYDFHITEAGPKLIEVNTNAGGAFLNAFLARAQLACCEPVHAALREDGSGAFEDVVRSMFESEWRRQRGDAPLRSIAIVDDEPEGQYLHPEFVLAQRLLQAAGYDVVIVSASALQYRDGALLDHDGRAIDLVYNRLTDFAFEAPEHGALREAYIDGAAVVTPNPHNHALLADKRNLINLSDQTLLTSWGLPPEQVEALRGVPPCVVVTAANADALWAERKRYYFKPADGHAGKAVYRGEKLTRGAWGEILKRKYIAQEVAVPSERMIEVDGARVARKSDVRLYTYDGVLILAAARLYQGQTTNFRTPGGGFAPVFFI
ncbi:hypothetical protein U91I_03585 [alpha proteobacterium U9-1i]|nr:hypothetical protein U91I_03585 [alpha proteobacterium U9-1i]